MGLNLTEIMLDKPPKAKKKKRSRARQAYISKRNKLFRKQKGCCKACGVKMQFSKINVHNSATIDHIIPRSKGGTSCWDNIQLLCFKCNWNKDNDRKIN